MFSGLESPFHLLIVLVVILLVVGPKRLPGMGRSLGSGLREFKDGISGAEQPAVEDAGSEPPADGRAQPIAHD